MRVGILGCGKQAPKHLRGLIGAGVSPDEIVVGDREPTRAEALAAREGVRVLSPEDLLADPSVGTVVIATPLGTHVTLIQDAIERGKGFLCEKPLAGSAVEAKAIQAQAETRDVIGMVGMTYRSVPVFRQVEAFVRTHQQEFAWHLGVLRIGGRGSHEAWKHRRQDGGGALNEMLIHMLDLALGLFGPPADIRLLACELRAPVRKIRGREERVDAEDVVLVRASYPEGPTLFFEADMLTPAFTQRLELEGAGVSLAASIDEREASYLYLDESKGSYPQGRTSLTDVKEDPYVQQSRVFLTAITHATPPLYGTLDEAVLLHELLDALHLQKETFL